MSTQKSAPTAPPGGLFAWVLLQVGQLAILVGNLIAVGLVVAIVKRRFSWRAFFAGTGVMVAGAAVTVAAVGSRDLQGWHDAALIGGILAAMAVGGLCIGRVGAKVGFWESYLAALVLLLLGFLHFGLGVDTVLRGGFSAFSGTLQALTGFDLAAIFKAHRVDAYADLWEPMSPGVRLLGPMWQRLVGLLGFGGLLTALMGGSVAFLLWSDHQEKSDGLQFEWLIAKRHLSGRRRGAVSITAYVAVLGIALGVAALVTVTAVMSGYQEDIQNKILSINAHLVVQKYGVDFEEYAHVAQLAQTVDQVLAASPFVFNEVMLSTGSEGIGVWLKGVDPRTAGAVTDIERTLCSSIDARGACVPHDHPEGALARVLAPQSRNLGSTSDADAPDAEVNHAQVPSLIVGAALLERLKVPIGAPVTLTTPAGMAGIRGHVPKRMDFRIGGVFRWACTNSTPIWPTSILHRRKPCSGWAKP